MKADNFKKKQQQTSKSLPAERIARKNKGKVLIARAKSKKKKRNNDCRSE